MKTDRSSKKKGARMWARLCSLTSAFALLSSLALANETPTRVAIRPGAASQTDYSRFHPANDNPSGGGFGTPDDFRPSRPDQWQDDFHHEDRSYVPTAPPRGILPNDSGSNSPGFDNWSNDGYRYEDPRDNSMPVKAAPSLTKPTIDEELTYRYTDPRMIRFLQSTSMSQLTSLYMEASQYIDQRHVNPIPYEQRTQQALANLARAIENPTFLQAVRATGNPANARQAQAELNGLASRQPARSAQEAVSVMQYAASILNRSMGIPLEATALEFINGTIDSLDQFSAYVPAETAQGPSAGLEEHIVGIGVELKAHDEGLQIVGVVEGGPAEAAKLQRGDIIVAIDNQSIQGMSLNQGADLITGPAGTNVRLNIVRDGRNGSVSLQRQSVYVSSVTGVQMVDPQKKVGYIRLKQFSESSSQDLDKALWQLYQAGMQTLIFDLRGNPGGLLTAAIDISDKFIAQGSIVSTKGRHAEDNSNEMATFDRTWKIPLVVLIDENSASASEIFAAAIQDNERGVIVGRRSYGKGTVQTHFPMQSVGGDLKLTTAKFYSPKGREMAGSGVIPDVRVPASGAGLNFAPDRDGDIIAAIRLAADGRPAELAQRAGNTQSRPQGVSQFSL